MKKKNLKTNLDKKKNMEYKTYKKKNLLGRYRLPSFFVSCKTKEAHISIRFLIENSFSERLTVKVVKTNVIWPFCVTHHVGVRFNALNMSIRIDIRKNHFHSGYPHYDGKPKIDFSCYHIVTKKIWSPTMR
jgi:hypothetical protein